MPGDQPKKNYKRLLSVTLSALCLINLLAPMMGPSSQPVNAQAQGQGQGLLNLNQCSANQSFEATMFAVTTDNRLLNFNPGSPGIINGTVNITGLGQGENILGIDFRAANGQLYALSSASRLYIINPTNGAATPVGAPLATAVNGANFGFDFNPTVDRIRLVSDADQDLRLNPNNAAIAGVDGMLAFATVAASPVLAANDVNAGQDPNVVAVAYTNNFAGSTTTTLYGIDSARDILVTQGTAVGVTPAVGPNTGQLFTVGPLGVDAGDVVGFDIAPVTNAAFAVIAPPNGGISTLYTINLATGAAVSLGPINARQTIRDIAFAVRAENVFAVTASNRLIKFNPGLPGAVNNSIPISGIGGENIVGIDFRPATGVLFALSDANRIYTINTTNGVATPVGGPTATALNGASFGFDFNPTVDRIRLVSDADQDLRLNPNNAAIAGVDGTLTYAATDTNATQNPNIVGSAYTANFLGSPATTLYNIDSNLNTLVTQGTAVGVTPAVGPNTGQLFTVGPLGVDVNAILGFDISSESGAAFASINSDSGGPTQIYQINLMTGAATSLGAIGVNEVVRDIAIEVRLPNVIALTASNLLVHFNAATPGIINMIRVIRGLPRREKLVAIDFRPAAGYLYALSASNRAYLIVLSDPARALAVRLNPLNPALNGANFGFDFNPVPDAIRITSDADQNLRANPNTGAVAGMDGTLTFAAGDANAAANPMLVGSAYTNSFLGAKTTTLYGIDAGLGALVTQGSIGGAPISPNTGQLFTVGSLGVPTGTSVGFDIASPTNAAFASLTPPGANQSQFYSVNLNSGAATLIGGINLSETVTGITLGGVARQGFDICLQDDRTGSTLQFDSCTGDYQFSKCGAGAFVQTGRGNTSFQNNTLTLRANNVFAIVNVNPGSSLRSGTAVVRVGRIVTVNDNNTSDNTCGCR